MGDSGIAASYRVSVVIRGVELYSIRGTPRETLDKADVLIAGGVVPSVRYQESIPSSNRFWEGITRAALEKLVV